MLVVRRVSVRSNFLKQFIDEFFSDWPDKRMYRGIGKRLDEMLYPSSNQNGAEQKRLKIPLDYKRQKVAYMIQNEPQ